VREQGLGLAPGAAFGPEGEGYVRWCFASSEERLAEGARRLAEGIARSGRALEGA
jgi:aspartate/methionine/tyrosine aminotransferase